METKTLTAKISENWLTLLAAAFFDIAALVPGLSVIFNAAFSGFLFFRFGTKKFAKTGLTMAGGIILDAVFGVLPVNLASAFVRIITL